MALDRVLRLDPEASHILAPLDGKSVEVEVTGAFGIQVLARFAYDRIELNDIDPSLPGETRADVCIRGSLTALVALARGGDELPSSSQVTVQGDLAVLSQARTALLRLRPDFDEPLAQLLGDEVAYPVSRIARKVFATTQRSIRELAHDVGEYVGEESQLLATQDDVQLFSDKVDQLRDAMDRLDKRVARAEARVGEKAP